MANYIAKRLIVKGEDQLLTISSPHPLTKKDLEALIQFVTEIKAKKFP